MKAFDDYCLSGSERRRQHMQIVHDYTPNVWSNHFLKIDKIIAEVMN